MSDTYYFQVRWGDLDAQGHVNNGVGVDYLQEARVRFFRNGPCAQMLATGVVVVGHQVEYAAPIEFSATGVEVELFVDRVGGAKLRLGYEVRQNGRTALRARTTLCPFDFTAGLPRRFTPDERAYLRDLVEPLEPLRDLGRPVVGEHAHVHEFWPRWSDQDIYRHVNNVRYYDLFQEARIHATTDADPSAARTTAASSAQYLWLVARQDVDYLAQLDYRETPYQVRTGVAKIGRTSLTLVAELADFDEGQVFARARSVLVCAGPDGRPTPLPADVADSVSRWLVDG